MNNLRFHDKIVVRIPSLPVTSSGAPDLLDIFLKDKFLSEALFLASPDLHAECARLFNDPDHFSKKDAVRITQSLLKYYLRMKTRCTPFGLFAGCGCITWGTENSISVEPGYNRYTRLDMHFQGALSEYLSQQNSLKNNLLFYPNNSLYILHDKLRYIEYFYLEKRKEFKISSVDNSEILEKILQISKNGVLLKDLANSITNDEITFEEAFSFVNELTDEQILVSEFFPGVTGTDNFEIFRNRIEGLAGENDSMQELNGILSKISASVKKLDDKIVNETDEYENIIKTVSHFNIPTDKNKLFQVDLMRKATGTIEKSITYKIVEVIDLLKPFSINNKNQSLEKFKEKFSERYEGKEICLPFVLDNETGLGYNRHTSEGGADNILVDDLFLPVANGSSQIEEKDRILLSVLIEALNKRKYTVDLKSISEKLKSENDFEFSLPATFYSMFKIINENGQEKILLEATGGTSAANIIGRFAYASDELKQVLSDINQFEEEKYKGAIVAEIIHLPENRTGNILFRPVFRKHEIPYLAKPSVNNNFQVAISDLFISIINGRIVLRSKSLNKEIIPRLSNAHNYSFNSLPLYNFLCDLQAQKLNPGINFSWGALAFAFNFLPRVEHNDLIISPAKWKFIKNNYNELIKSNETSSIEDLKKWRSEWNLPDRIIIAEADNELSIDFNDKSHCELFLSILKKRDYIDLSECLLSQNPSGNIVKDNKGQFYAHQFLSFIFNEDYRFEPVLFSGTGDEPERTFSIGSRWIYFKFYCGTKTADRILIETILPLTGMLMENKWIEKWFFIRYWDPENHLRVRFYVPEFNNYLAVIDCVKNYFENYQKSGLIWKIQLDTYQREMERYNCDNIENSESIFFIDSCNTLQFLTLIEGPQGEEIKLLFGIRLIDDLLNCFDFSMDKKILIIDQMKTSFTKEFRIDKNLKIQLDDRYRKLRKKIEDFFNDKALEENLPEVYYLLIEKKSQLMPVIHKISGLFDSKTGSIKMEEIIFSYIHMSMNRLFSSKQRVAEMLIYYLVHKHYGSQRAILNKRKIPDEIPAL